MSQDLNSETLVGTVVLQGRHLAYMLVVSICATVLQYIVFLVVGETGSNTVLSTVPSNSSTTVGLLILGC